MQKYIYKGPVMEFDKCIMNHWESQTVAPSKKKAKSNFKYQFKKQHDRLPTAMIELPGIILESD